MIKYFFFLVYFFISTNVEGNPKWNWENISENHAQDFLIDRQKMIFNPNERSVTFYKLNNYSEIKKFYSMNNKKIVAKSSVVLNKLNCLETKIKHLKLKLYREKDGVGDLGEFNFSVINLPTEKFSYPPRSIGMRVTKRLCEIVQEKFYKENYF